MAYDFLYIIGNLLERRCLKWARIAHLDIWNTSYGQKKGNLTPDHKKSGINPIYLVEGGVPHTIGKLLMRVITLL
jgi:hypothetical protein